MNFTITLIIWLSALYRIISFKQISFSLQITHPFYCHRITFTTDILAIFCPQEIPFLTNPPNSLTYYPEIQAHLGFYTIFKYIILESHIDRTHSIYIKLQTKSYYVQLSSFPSIDRRYEFYHYLKTSGITNIEYGLYDVVLKKHRRSCRSEYVAIGLAGAYFDKKVGKSEKIDPKREYTYSVGNERYRSTDARKYWITFTFRRHELVMVRCEMMFWRSAGVLKGDKIKTVRFRSRELLSVKDLDAFLNEYTLHSTKHVFEGIKIIHLNN
jgi:hypothetical protein